MYASYLAGFLLLSQVAFGQSTSSSTGKGAWGYAYFRANSALAKLSNADKVSLATGIGWEKGPCVGNIAPLASIGFPELCLQDSPLGVRFATGVTAFPAGIMAGSTWDVSLMSQRGAAIGAETKALGVHVILGPVAGPLGKIPEGGRGWEGFSNDPYLSGIAMQHTIQGIQSSGAQACAKHYIGNEQELNRNSMSSNIADRVLHELYLWPFADSVQANVASVMCSYNKLNETYACENNPLLSGLLKGELGFQGYVVSDWAAQHTTTGSANAGMDMAMPGDDFGGGHFIWGQNLLDAVANGSVPQSRLDDMARRILASWYLLGQDTGYPATSFSSWDDNGGPDVQDGHASIARTVARDGIVLLKNSGSILPFKAPSSLAIIGLDAIVNPAGPNSCTDRACDNGTLAMGWGSGTTQFPFLVDPLTAITNRATPDGTHIVTSTVDDPTAGAAAAAGAKIAIVFINADSGEGYLTVEGNAGDRNNLDPWHNGNELVQAVAAVNPNTVVVIHAVGPVILEQFIDLPNVKAVVWAGIPGEESGNALVDVIYGSVSPSGKLPYTIAKSASDYGTSVVPGDDSYPEGLFIDYRHFDQAGIQPRFEFGFGLSYSSFTYSNLRISGIPPAPYFGLIPATDSGTLYGIAATVTATIKNTGWYSSNAAEVAQLYMSLPSSAPASPPRQLRGFEKFWLGRGQATTVTFPLRWKDLAYWDSAAQGWRIPRGQYTFSVGASSRDLRLTGKAYTW